jgi:hypothetical protein
VPLLEKTFTSCTTASIVDRVEQSEPPSNDRFGSIAVIKSALSNFRIAPQPDLRVCGEERSKATQNGRPIPRCIRTTEPLYWDLAASWMGLCVNFASKLGGHGRELETCSDLGLGRRRLQPAHGRGRGQNAGSAFKLRFPHDKKDAGCGHANAQHRGRGQRLAQHDKCYNCSHWRNEKK